MDSALSSTLVYEIDDSDRLVAVNDTWTAFAKANDAPELTAPEILGLKLWDAISDPTTQALYRSVLGRVRSGEAIQYTYRCDGPATRRDMSMRVSLDGRYVRFTSRIEQATARDPQPILDLSTRRNGEFISICSWCNRLSVTDVRWEEVEVAIPLLGLQDTHTLPALTHGICPSCFDRMSAEFSA